MTTPPDSLPRCPQELHAHPVTTTLGHPDPALAAIVETLYERTIDCGAHPSERAVTGNPSITDTQDG